MSKRWSTGRHSVFGSLTVGVLVLGLGVWGTQTELAGAVIAPGQIEVEGRIQVVEHPDGGVVAEIVVREGDRVSAGQPLLRLDGSDLSFERSILAGQLDELVLRSLRLETERDAHPEIQFSADHLARRGTDTDFAEVMTGQINLFTARLQTYEGTLRSIEEQQEQTRSEIIGQEAQLRSMEDQLGLVDEELANQESLRARGLTTAAQVLTLRRERARLEGLKGETTAAVARNRGRIAQLENEKLQIAATRRETAVTELRDIAVRRVEVQERLRSVEDQLSRLELRAPMSGVIHDMRVNSLGAVLRPADPVLFVVPQDQEMIVAARVDSLNVDSVFPGQQAFLQFSAFQARTTPQIKGEVTRVSPDVLQDPQTGQVYYAVYLEATETEIERLGDVDLVPGMPVESFIQTGARTPLNYLLKPLTDYFNKAFREE